jgi:hypothetical protein
MSSQKLFSRKKCPKIEWPFYFPDKGIPKSSGREERKEEGQSECGGGIIKMGTRNGGGVERLAIGILAIRSWHWHDETPLFLCIEKLERKWRVPHLQQVKASLELI